MPTFLLFLRMLVALAIVLALVFVTSRLLARVRGMSAGAPRGGRAATSRRAAGFGGLGGSGRRSWARQGLFAGLGASAAQPPGLQIDVVARRALSRTSSLVVVRAGGERYLLLGMTAQSVQLIVEIGAAPSEAPQPERTSSADAFPALEVLERATPAPVRSAAFLSASSPESLITDRPSSAPWTALPDDPSSTTAWDAFLASLRERTVRR